MNYPLPRTQEEFWHFMAPRLLRKDDPTNEWFSVSNMGETLDGRWYYVPENLAPLDSANRVYVDFDSHHVTIVIDPRYHYTQNRERLELKDEYRGEPESWSETPWENDGLMRKSS